MKPIQSFKLRTRTALSRGLLALADAAGIDLMDLAYRQRELCVCDVGEREFLRYALKPMLANENHSIILDVGGNRGGYTAWILDVFPNACVHGFEPNPPTFEAYATRYQDDGRVKAHPLGLTNAPGAGTIYSYAKDRTTGHASLAAAVLGHSTEDVDASPCCLETLDRLSESIPELANAAFIKLDIEGFELQALEGAGRVLSNPSLRAVQFEFNSMNVHTRVFLKDFYELFGSDFEFFRLNSRGMERLGNYSARNELFTYQNLVAVRRSWSYLCPSRWPQFQQTDECER